MFYFFVRKKKKGQFSDAKYKKMRGALWAQDTKEQTRNNVCFFQKQ